MTRLLFVLVLVCSFFLSFKGAITAQTLITVTQKVDIPDHPEYHDDRDEADSTHNHANEGYEPLVLYVPVSGLPARLDTNFGLERIILSLKHPRISDIKVELLSPDSTVLWLTNRNGRNGADYNNVAFSQRGFSGPISAAQTPFEGDFQPDGNMAALNNGQDPNGIWLLRISDLSADSVGFFESITLIFSDKPAKQRITPCSFSNPKACQCSRPDGRLLPDLVVSANGTGANMWEIAYDPQKGYGMLMFEVRAMNLGEGPLELEGTDIWLCGRDTVANRHVLCKNGDITHDSVYPRQIFRQNIYVLNQGNLVKTSRQAGTMAFDAHPGHTHFHADYYARFSLLKPLENEPDTSKWPVVGNSRKASFCLWDMQFCDDTNKKCDYKGQVFDENTLLNYGLGTYTSCDDPKRQGISVGGIDWYGLHYDGQNLRLDQKVTNGLYFLKIEIDPFNFYEEADEANNTLLLPVVLRFQQD